MQQSLLNFQEGFFLGMTQLPLRSSRVGLFAVSFAPSRGLGTEQKDAAAIPHADRFNENELFKY
jgi:hypothetical protein